MFVAGKCCDENTGGVEKDMIIRPSKVKKGIYPLNAFDNLSVAGFVIQSENITVYVNNAVLNGSNNKTPDEFYSGPFSIKRNKNITIKNFTAKR